MQRNYCWPALAGCLLAVHADAAAQSPLEVTVVAERRVAAFGEHPGAESSLDSSVRYVPATQVQLGEQLYFTVRVRNNSAEPIPNAVIEQAVPRNTRYIPTSARGPAADMSVSVDGGSSYGRLNELAVSTAIGARRPATAADCTHLRWRLRYPLMPGATALLRFRAEFR